jgi:steroid delta-isomerase-like uncharacterized protein
MSAQDSAAIGRRWYELWNERDFDGASTLVDGGAVIIETPTNETFRGPDGSREENQKWATAFPDGRVEFRDAIPSDEAVALELTFRGTNTGPFASPTGEIPPTGRPVEFDYCTLWRIENGKIVAGRHYYDTATVMRQLGLLDDVPAGDST